MDLGEKMKAEMQARIDEPLIAVGVLQPAGTWVAMGGDQLSGIVGSLMRKNANKRSSGLQTSAFHTKMAVVGGATEGRVYAFNARAGPYSARSSPGRRLRTQRPEEVTATPGKMSTQFVIDVTSTGDRFELETNALMGVGGFTAAFVAALEGSAKPED